MHDHGTVLFLPISKGNLLEMVPIAEGLKQEGIAKPVFCLWSKAQPHAERVREYSPVRSDGSPIPQMAPEEAAIKEPKETKDPSARERMFSFAPPLFRWLILLRAHKRRAQKLLDKFPDARLIVTAGDRSVGIETAVVAEAKKRGIPSLIVPFAMSFPEAAAEERLRSGKNGGEHAVDTMLKKILRRVFPSWVFVHKGVPLFFQKPYEALAAWFLCIMPRKPWIIGGGEAAKMAVESEALREQLLKQGMEEQKMIVTGKPGLDEIAGQLAHISPEEVRMRLGIGQNEKFILCAVPNFGEHNLLPWDEHRKEIIFIFNTLAATGAKVMLSLHPSCDRSWYQPFADDAGITIADDRIYAMLPGCDLLISIYSSIVAQAITLKKPSVIMDFHEFNYPVYDSAPGVTIAREKKTFLSLLKRFTDDEQYYASRVQEMENIGNRWAMLDGKNTERVLALIKELIG